MTKKIIVSLFLLMLFSGCSANYKIKIGDGVIKETFTTVENNLDTALIKDETERNFKDYSSFYGTDYNLYTSFYSLYADGDCVVNCETYDKSFIDDGKKVGFTLTHDFTTNTYGDSSIANELFPGFEAYFDGRYLTIKGGNNWNFVNNYRNFDDLKIEIESDYKVLKTNGKKDGNTYTWNIDKTSVDTNPSLYMKIDMQEEVNNSSKAIKNTILVFAILLLIGIIVGAILFKKNKEQNNI